MFHEFDKDNFVFPSLKIYFQALFC